MAKINSSQNSRRISKLVVLSVCGVSHATTVGVRPAVDPCHTLCALHDTMNCFRVQDINGSCHRLFWDEAQTLKVADQIMPGWTQVTTEEARSMVSTNGESCQSICKKTRGCNDSFCKDNNHCQALFWESVSPQMFCYHSSGTPCRQDKPVLCGLSAPRASSASPNETNPTVELPPADRDVQDENGMMNGAITSSEPAVSVESISQQPSSDELNQSSSPSDAVTSTERPRDRSDAVTLAEETDANQSAQEQNLAAASSTKSSSLHSWSGVMLVFAAAFA